MSEAERNAYYERQRRRRRRDAKRRERQRKCAARWATVGLMAVMLLTVLACAAGDRAAAQEQSPTPTVSTEAARPAETLATLPMPEPTAATIVATEPEPELTYLGVFRITHYCACKKCCGKDESDPWYGITATGTRATEGRTIAVDPDVIPYGSRVAVFYDDGRICYYTAEDCGGAIDGNEIDVFIGDHDRAWNLGVLSGCVYIVNEE